MLTSVYYTTDQLWGDASGAFDTFAEDWLREELTAEGLRKVGIEPRSKYAGMSYCQASREAHLILQKAAQTGAWFEIVEELAELRDIMKRRLAIERIV